MSLRSRLLKHWLRITVRRYMARMRDPVLLRTQIDRLMRFSFRPAPLSLHLPANIGGVSGLWVSNRPSAEQVILYFHGGGYFFGSARTQMPMLSHLAQRTGLRVFSPDYRLAPEYPFPAAFDDALAAWHGLLGKGYRPDQIVLGGDSAGGGLALALLAHLCQAGQCPAALFTYSPWTDLTLTGASLITNAASEQILPAHRLTDIRALILGGARPHEAGDPKLSPLYAAFPSPPPVQIFVAETEILRDDSLRMRNRLPDAAIRLVGDLPHVWPMYHDLIPEAHRTLDDTAAFIRLALARP